MRLRPPFSTDSMHARLLLATFALVLVLAPAGHAQLNTTVGPATVPTGGELVVTFSNDSGGSFGVSLDWIRVTSPGGSVVYADTTFEFSALMGPHGSSGFTWNLADQSGNPVPPGAYRVEVKSDFGAASTFHTIRIVDDAAGLVFEGTPTIHPTFGTSGPSDRNFYLQSPNDPGAFYFLLGAASSNVGIPTCRGTFPLDFDPLLQATLVPDAIFSNSFGVLNANGTSKAPRFPLPNDPSLVGIQVQAAFVVFDPLQSCGVIRISNVHHMTVT